MQKIYNHAMSTSLNASSHSFGFTINSLSVAYILIANTTCEAQT